MSLRAFLRRLIWLSVLPLLALAAYFAFDQADSRQTERDRNATGIVYNVATAIDRHLGAQIATLQVMAASPLLDDPPRLNEFYRVAQGFYRILGGHVVLADPSMRVLFNTRVPIGEPLPEKLPRPKGHAAAPTALDTGEPSVGDMFFGPVAKEPLIAVAVPAIRDGRTKFLLLAVIETRQFQQRLDEVSLTPGWAVAVLDGAGGVIAQRSPPGFEVRPAGEQDSKRFAAQSAVSSWSVVLEVPRHIYRAPALAAAAALAAAILAVTLASVLGGSIAARRLTRAVTALAESPAPHAVQPAITEIEGVRQMLVEAAAAREAAESTQREGDRRFRATFEQAAVGIAHVALDGRWLRVNQKLCDIAGYTREELLTKKFQDITHPDDLEADLAYERRVLAGEIKTYSMDKRYVRKDGAIVWIKLTISLVREPTGKPDYFISVVEDITEHKRAEAERESARQFLQTALDSITDGIALFDRNERLVLWNENYVATRPQLRNFFKPGLTFAEIVGHLVKQGGYIGVDRDWVETRLRQFRTLKPVELHLRDPDGGERWTDVHHYRTRDGGTFVVRTDITARKRAEEVLRKTEERFRTLVDNFTQGILVQRDFIPRYANQAAASIFGYEKPDDLLALPSILPLFASKERARLTDYYRLRLAGKPAPLDYEMEGLKKDGTRVWVNIRGFRIDWEGAPVICLALFDVTEQKEVQAQLRQAQKMEAIGNLTGGMAHDFNNYLAVIIGNLDLLKEHAAKDREAEQLVDAALRGALRSAELTQHLLAFSRRQPLDSKLTNVGERVSGVANLFRRMLGEDIVLKVATAPGIWPVLIDGPQLDSCIINLANNARDAMPKGGELAISVGNVQLDDKFASANPDVAAGDYVLVEISDTGNGMPPEVLARVFEPFFTTKGPGHGTGLGLSMAYGFVKQSQGHINIHSEVGHGTTIRIYLPRAREGDAAAATAHAASPELPKGRETVLAVDDNASVRKTVAKQLAALGYQVIMAENGDAALAIVEQRDRHIDLLFTDIVMPGKIDGLELARLAAERRPDLKVLLTSGFPGDSSRGDRRLAPGWRLLPKPYRIGELARALRDALGPDPSDPG